MTSASSTKPQVERWAGAGLCEVADPLPGRPSQLAENQDGWRGGSRPESPSVLGGPAPPGRGVAASCWFIPETKAGLEAAPGILCASRRGETGRVLPGEGLGEGEAPPGHTWLPFCKAEGPSGLRAALSSSLESQLTGSLRACDGEGAGRSWTSLGALFPGHPQGPQTPPCDHRRRGHKQAPR